MPQWLALSAVVAICQALSALGQEAPQIRVGMIGLDTSHVPSFAKFFNGPKLQGELAGIKVVAAYPGGTDFPPIRDRVAMFTEQVRAMGIEIVDNIPALLQQVDVVLLEGVNGRIHLQEATPVIKAGKPLFIDRPAAGSLADVIAIFDLAKDHNVPCFSSASVRFGAGLQELKQNETLGTIVGAQTWGPCSYQEGTPDRFFYGVHGIEALFTRMGTGCGSVSRVQTEGADLLTGRASQPVSPEEKIEIFELMEAADESKRQSGTPVSPQDVMAKARKSLEQQSIVRCLL